MCSARLNERENGAAQLRNRQRLGKSVDAVVQWLFGERDDARSQRRKYVEPLEPRWMLSGSPQPLTFKMVNPAGVQVYDGAASGNLTGSSDSSVYQIVLNAAGKMSVAATPADSSMQLEVTITDDGTGNVLAGPVTASTQGASVGLQNVALASGLYDVTVTEVGPVSGNFTIDAKANSFVQIGTASNTTTNAAMDLSGSSLTLAGGTQQFAAFGTGDSGGSTQYYKLNLAQGQFVSAAMSGVTSVSGKYGSVQLNTVPNGTVAVATGDLNGDGLLDIAAVGADPGNSDGLLTVLINNGDGTYSATQYTTPRPGLSVAIGAVNGDGSTSPDIIVGDGDSGGGDWTEFYGDGAGHFNGSNSIPDPQEVTAVAIADINHDGINDVILGCAATDGQSGHLGISITNVYGIGYPSSSPITGIAVADFNGDGNIDIVASYGNGANGGGGIGIYLGSGQTSDFNPFPNINTYGGGTSFDAVAVGDVNRDGIPDVVALEDGQDSFGNANVNVFDLNSDGSVASNDARFIDAGDVSPGASIALGDFNGDGYIDLIATSGPGGNLGGSNNNIIVASGTSDGQFGYTTTGYSVPDASGLVVADVTGDGRPDLIVASPDNNGGNNSGAIDILPDSGPLSGGSGALSVYMPSGALLAAGTTGDDVASAVQGFVAPISGTYVFSVTPAPSEQFTLAVDRGGAIGLYPTFFAGQGQNLNGAHDVSGYLDPSSGAGYFEFQANPGDTITLNFTEPLGPGANATNPLSVGIQFDAPGDQHVIQFANNSLTYTVPAGAAGNYSMFLSAVGGAGIYDMQISGITGTPPEVVTGDGTTSTHILQSPPTAITISASHPISNYNVNPADITMDGVAATSYSINYNTISATFPASVDTGDGNYTLHIATGAFTSLTGVPVTAFDDAIIVDRGPRVTSSTISGGEVVNPGLVTENLTFSEPLLVLIESGPFGILILNPSEFQLTNQTTGQTFTPTSFRFGPEGNDLQHLSQVNMSYSNLPEGSYELRLISGGFAGIQDLNNVPLNGDYNGTLPSGDGYAGGDFVLDFRIDASAPTPLGPPAPLAPLGSQAYAFTPNALGAIDTGGDVDDYTISGQAGDQLSATVKVTSGGFAPQVQLIAPGGAVVATATAGNGGSAVFQNVSLPTTGVYTIEVTSLDGTGGYTLTPYLNLTVDSTDTALLPGNSTGTAQPLDFGDTDAGGVTRAAVSAAGDGTNPQFYSVTLTAGERISTALHLTGSTPPGSVVPGTLELLNSTGQVIAIGTAVDPSDYVLSDFAAPAAGTYYLRVLTSYSYVMSVTTGASIETEPDDTAVLAQDLSRTNQVTGYLSSGDTDNYTFNATVGDSLVLQTATPDDLGAGPNGLQVLMTLYAPDGTLILSNHGGALGDAHDSRITYTVPSGGAGTYRVVLTSISSTTGTYTLTIAGSTAAATVTQPTVVNVTPAATGSVATPPTTITFTFSEPIDPNSVSASDLSIGEGASVASVSIIDGKTIQFALNVPNIDQFFFYSIAAGALTSLQGQPVAAYSSYFHVDKTGPYFVSQDPGSNTIAPFSTWTFTSVEPLAPFQQSFADPSTIASFTGPGGVDLRNQIYSIKTSGLTLTITFIQQTAAGTYTMVLGSGYTDLVGNKMDQNHNRVNGETPGDDYSASTVVGSPDLQVTSILPTNGAVYGTPTNVSWTVTNTGTADATGSWVDDVYLSSTGTLDGSQILLGRFTRPNTLAAGASYTNTQSLTFPLTNSSEPGTEYIIVVTNSTGAQIEGASNNNTTTAQDPVTLPAIVDFAESNLSAPLNLASGQTAVLNWTLSNFGTKDFTGSVQEVIRLSNDSTVGNDQDLLYVTFTGSIPIGQSVSRTATITVPQGISGQDWFVVVANPSNQIFEHGQTANNSAITASATNIALSPAPDLIATNVTGPSAVFTGKTVTITWTDSNQGSENFDGSFTDSIGLATDATGDNLQNFLDVAFSGPIVIGGSVQRTATFTISANFPAGNYYPVVRVDSGNDVYENPSGETNNLTIGSSPIAITVPALPDLTVSNVQTPVQATAGQAVPITWTITNNGTAAATGPWQDQIFLSTDAAGNNRNLYLVYSVATTLAPGASITLTQNIRLPETLTGTYYVVVQTDTDGAVFESNPNNNLGVSATAFTVTPALYPDLVVSNVNAPNSAFSGQTTQITWFVSNNGTGATTVPAWYDNVYVSTQQTYDGTAKLLGTFLNPSYLASGQSYQNTATVTLPVGIQGTYYFIIQTDSGSNVDEFGPNGETNNFGTGGATQVTLTPPPDLRVASLSAPSQAFSGQPLTVSWDVKNFGPGPTIATQNQWSDIVYLSRDPVLDPLDTQLAVINHAGGLAVGQDYLASAGVVLPTGISGNYYLLVVTDGFNQVTEAGFEGNNTGFTPVAITLTPPPDLAVTSVTAPTAIVSGHAIAVSYTVANEGSSPTPNSGWSDYLYLSQTPTVDSSAIFLGGIGRSGQLAPGDSYSSVIYGTVPSNLASGTYYAIVVTDAGQQVFELNRANNTLAAASTAVTYSPPDLVVASATAPGTAASGGGFLASWTVKNQGTGDTSVGSWSDYVYLSSDTILGDGDDILLGQYLHTGLLAPGASYASGNQSVVIPSSIPAGNYYLLIATDGGQNVYEGPTNSAAELNNASAPQPITITHSSPDLQVSTVSTLINATQGGIATANWTVVNAGNGPTGANYWYDDVYMSPVPTVNGNSTFVGRVQHSNVLGAGGSYNGSSTFTIPASLPVGTYYVLVVTDSQNYVSEPGKEGNNITASTAFSLGAGAEPNLAVSNITVPSAATSGQPITVSYTVSNNGNALAFGNANGSWYDIVYLSQDQNLDPTNDISLGYNTHFGGLAAGAHYTDTFSYTIPAGLTGSYYAFVVTDTTNRVSNDTKPADNIGITATKTVITTPPPTDIAIGTVTLPTPAVSGLGQNISITYTVQNLSGVDAVGVWQDTLYLSTTPNYTAASVPLGSVTHLGGVAAGNSYTQTLTAAVPGVNPGNYYIIVRTDIRNVLPETTKANNVSASLGTVLLSLATLTVGQPATGTLSTGQSIYYQVTVPYGQTLYVTESSDQPSSSNEMFIRYGQVPTRSTFDQAYSNPLSPNQSITVPFTLGGTYYILLYGSSVSGAENYTLTASLPQFSVNDINYGIGGTAGQRTIQINGAKFDRTDTATLTHNGVAVASAVSYYYVTQSRFYATFDLTKVAPGTYDVTVGNSVGGSVVVPNSFQVVAGGGADVQATLDAPGNVRHNTNYSFSVDYSNDGINDGLSPLLVVTGTTPIGLVPAFLNSYAYTFFGAAPGDGPPGILIPGTTGSQIFFSNIQVTNETLTVGKYATDPTQPFDYSALASQLIDATETTAAFNAAFARMQQDIGPAIGDVLKALAADGNIANIVDGGIITETELLQINMDRARAELTTSITGSVNAPDVSVNIANQVVTATNTGTGQVFATMSLRDGSFIFPYLTPGTYHIIFNGAVVDGGGSNIVLAAGQHLKNVLLSLSHGESFGGTVRDPATGLVIPNASVTVIDSVGDTFTTSTDANGHYAFSGLPSGATTVYAQLAGYARSIQNFTPSPGTNPPDFSLAPEATLTGTLALPPNNSIVIVQAQLNGFTNAGGSFTATVSGNRFSFTNLPAGTYALTISQLGSVQQTGTFTIAAGEHADLGTVTLSAAASVTGTVSSADPSISTTGVPIEILSAGTVVGMDVTDASGAFSFGGLPAGPYVIRALPLLNVGNAPDVNITLTSGQPLSGVSATIFSGDTLQGTVTANNIALSGATVVAVGPDGIVHTASTDGTGKYVFTHLLSGAYTVSVPGAVTPVVLPAPDNSQVTADLAVVTAATIRGRLTVNGQPIVGTVVLYDGGVMVASVGTDSQGNYLISLAQPGTYGLGVQTEGNASFATATLTVAGGQSLVYNFTPGTAGIAITVVDPISPVTGDEVFVSFETPGGLEDVASLIPAADGTVHAQNLVAGTYVVTATGPGDGRIAIAEITVTTGGSAAVTLTPVIGGQISGSITDGANSNAALSGALVQIYKAAGETVSGFSVSKSDGSFVVKGLADGIYDVVITAPGHQAIVLTGVTVSNGTASHVNQLMAAATSHLSGKLLDASGRPIPGGAITVTDSAGHTTGSAFAGADGSFVVSGVSGTNLTVTAQAGGYRLRTFTVSVASNGTVAMGNIALTFLAFFGTTPDAASSTAMAIVAGPAVRPAGVPNQTPSFGVPSLSDVYGAVTSFQNYYQQYTEDYQPNPLAITPGQLPPLDVCRHAIQAYADALNALFRQNRAYNAAKGTHDTIPQYISIAIKGFLADLIVDVGAMVTLVTTVDAIATLVAGGLVAGEAVAGSSVSTLTAGTFGLGGQAVGGANFAVLAIQLTNGVATLAGNIISLILAPPPDKEAASTAATTQVFAIHSLYNSFINALANFQANMGFGTSLGQAARRSNLVGIIGNIYSLATQAGSLIDSFTFSSVSSSLAQLNAQIDQFNHADRNYNIMVARAYAALQAYNRALAAAVDDCHGQGNTNNTTTQSKVVTFPPGQDPNAISGPVGFGPANYTPATQPLGYQIQFENDPTAPGNVQVVKITTQLASNLDFRTFRLGTMDVGGTVISPSVGSAFYQARIDLTATLGVDMDVFAGVDVGTGQAFWTFTAIDPATGEQPINPLMGILPPNLISPQGEGFVSYTISPLKTAVTGAVIQAAATVLFDDNEPIDTPTVSNTLDTAAPASSVSSLPFSSGTNGINVSWSGTDDASGSGIASYTIYVSTNGGAYVPWLTNTTATSGVYAGTVGQTYSFYSLATDNVGNTEAPPTSAQATTTVGGASATLSGLAGNVAINYGTGTATFTGTVLGSPLAGEIVAVTLHGVTVNATLDGSGHFAATFDTSELSASATPYVVTYSYAGDTSLGGVSDTTSSTLTVNKATVIVTVGNATKVYGAADPTFGVGYGGFVNGDSPSALSGTLSYLTNEPTTGNANVGAYSISASGLSSSNYNIQYVAGSLSVTPASLTITANPVYAAYGQPIPTLTAGYNGFVGGDTPANLSTLPTLAATATSTSAVGPYAIMIGGAVDSNYQITYVPGTLTISQATPTIVLNSPPPTLVYDGTADVLSWATATLTGAGNGAASPSGVISYTYYAGPTVTGTPLASPPINPGTYTVVASYGGDANYTAVQTSATFTITYQNALLGASIQIDDGTAQRSMIRSIKVTFTSTVLLASGAITLVDSNGNPISFTQNTTDNITFTLTFSGTGGSLPNGRYTIVLHANAINASSGPKFDFDHALSFWRLFGDFYGTGTVNNADKALYTQAFKGQSPATVPYADYDGNHTLNSVDTNAFSANLGKSEVAPTQNLNTIGGTAGVDTIVLTLDADHQHIDWTMSSANGGYSSGQMIASDAAGLTINGNGGMDVIELNYANGNPLPSVTHLNGTFFVDGLIGTNPLAGKTLDINQSTVYLTYANTADPLSTIQSYLRTGYNGGDWKGAGNGVITSTAASQDATRATGIGYVDSARGLIPGMPADTIELKYTLYGDTGLSGSVGFTDFMRLTQHFTTTQAGSWAAGDFNYDGTVDTPDFAMLKANYGATLPASTPAVTATVTSTTKPTSKPVTTKPTSSSTTGKSSGSTAKTPAPPKTTKAPDSTKPVVTAAPIASKSSVKAVSTNVGANVSAPVASSMAQPKKLVSTVVSKIAELVSAAAPKDDKPKSATLRKKR